MIEYLAFRFALFLARITPFPVLFFFSDILYVVLYYFVGYRKKTVFQNLKLAFPDKTESERRKIAKKFYRHLADLFLETIKFYTLNKKQLLKHLQVNNPQILDEYFYRGQDVILASAHLGNWELGPLVAPLWFKHQFVILYKPLKNKRMNDLIKRIRSKYGSTMLPITLTARAFDSKDKPVCVVMLSDQNPPNPKKAIWTEFFGVPTATLHGLELYAKRYNLPIFFYDIYKSKRGKYYINLELLIEEPRECEKGCITARYMRRVEHAIKEKPYMWLWSHRRWKHRFDPQNFKIYQLKSNNS